jgi:hypothetical protein
MALQHVGGIDSARSMPVHVAAVGRRKGMSDKDLARALQAGTGFALGG